MRKFLALIALSTTLCFAGAKENLKEYLVALSKDDQAKALSLTLPGKEIVTKASLKALAKKPEQRLQFASAPIKNCTESKGMTSCTVELKKKTVVYELTKKGSIYLVSNFR